MGTKTGAHHKKLNEGQITVLHLLYVFRFATAAQLSKSMGKATPSVIYASLDRLEDQGYVGHYSEPSFKIDRRPAYYYLLPKGVKALQKVRELSQGAISIAKRNPSASEQLRDRQIAVYDTFHWLNGAKEYKLHFFTKSELDMQKYDYFPAKLPDAYFAVETDGAGEREFILDVYPSTRPINTALGRLKMYADYVQANTWGAEEGKHPVFIGLLDTKEQQYQLHHRLRGMLKKLHVPDFTLLTTTKGRLVGSSLSDAIWLSSKDLSQEVTLL
jgi:DNA-binding PadR family transcriptional regulator